MSIDTDMELFLQADELLREIERDDHAARSNRLVHDKQVAHILQMCADIELVLTRISDPTISALLDTVVPSIRRWCTGEGDEQSVIRADELAAKTYVASQDRTIAVFENVKPKINKTIAASGALPKGVSRYISVSQAYTMSASAVLINICNDLCYATHCLAAAAKIIATKAQ